MELIPIILKVLAVVAGLTVLTLIISYISFRTKQSRPIPENKKGNIPVSNSRIRNNTNLPDKLMDDKRKAAPIQSNTNRNTGKEHRSRNDYNKTHKKENPSEPKVRLEVLKQLSPEHSKTEEIIKKEEHKGHTNENLKSLNDNIFEKYADNDQNEMYTLHVKEKKDKPKEKK
jgi:hypothetical protein